MSDSEITSITEPAPPSGTPPAFGHPMLSEFSFDPSYTNLNNGSYGSSPNYVAKHCATISAAIESNTDGFMKLKLPKLMAETRSMLAQLMGATAEEIALVPNASHGVNTVLRNFEWNSDDILIGFSTTYGGISRTIRYVSDSKPNPKVHTIPVQFPTTHKEIVSLFERHVKTINRLPDQKVVAVIDGIASTPGCIIPWEAIVQVCKKENIWSLVDGAHCIGQIPLNLAKADPDFFVTNCHKWLYTKRSSAVLYVPKRNQHIIKSSFPTSFDYVSPSDPSFVGGPIAPNFVKQFEWNGTLDFANYLSVGAALRFREWLGGEEVINAYCHKLAMEGAEALAKVLGTEVMDPTGAYTANMSNVRLPFPDLSSLSPPGQFRIKLFLEETLLGQHTISCLPYLHGGKAWVRCSAQIWNEVSDFEKLGEVFKTIIPELDAFVKQLN